MLRKRFNSVQGALHPGRSTPSEAVITLFDGACLCNRIACPKATGAGKYRPAHLRDAIREQGNCGYGANGHVNSSGVASWQQPEAANAIGVWRVVERAVTPTVRNRFLAW